MTPEEQAAADVASAEAKAAEEAATAEKEKADFEASLEGLSDEEKEAKRAEKEANLDTNKIDYEAELEAERKRAEKAEKALADKRFKDAEKKRKAAEDDDLGDDDDDKPVTKRELAEMRAEERKSVQKERALELAKDLSESDKEAELIVLKWSNRSFPEGLSLSEQIEEMHAVVHRKRLVGERNEALRALKGKDGVVRNSGSSHQEEMQGKEPKLAPQDEQAIKAAGYVWNGVSRQFEKKLSNGDLLVRDSKTKQTKLIKKAK